MGRRSRLVLTWQYSVLVRGSKGVALKPVIYFTYVIDQIVHSTNSDETQCQSRGVVLEGTKFKAWVIPCNFQLLAV